MKDGENFSVSQDTDYKWRVVGAISVIAIVTAGLVVVAIFSQALTPASITGLFAMQFVNVLITVLYVLRYPSPNSKLNEKEKVFSMDNPLVGVPFSILQGIVLAFLLKLLGLAGP